MFLGEFEWIAHCFRPLAAGAPAALDLMDDAALLQPDPGQMLVITKDALVENVHFLASDPPDFIARKLIRVNYSDLAAMGATPVGFFLAIMLPESYRNTQWQTQFAAGLAEDQAHFGGFLLGGDLTTTSGPLALSLTALGTVPQGCALRRNAARVGDEIFVSGSLGDAAIGLRLLQKRIESDELDPKERTALIERYQLPQPRLELGQALAALPYARQIAAMDLSDGLAGDLEKLCNASGVGAEIDWPSLPISQPVHTLLAAGNSLPEDLIITGGDDYELLFTTPPKQNQTIQHISKMLKLPIRQIGKIIAAKIIDKNNVRFQNKTGTIHTNATGYRHF